MENREKSRRRKRWIIAITVWTFLIALTVGFLAHYSLSKISSLFLSFTILFIVVLLGIIFDLIGTAAAAADPAPLNAKAARKVFGAKKGVFLLKNAERVTSICNDVVGDVSGIVSGALAAIIVYRLLVFSSSTKGEFYLNILLSALVAALTVGGKAISKVAAINYSTEIILAVGAFLTRLSKPFGSFKQGSKAPGG